MRNNSAPNALGSFLAKWVNPDQAAWVKQNLLVLTAIVLAGIIFVLMHAPFFEPIKIVLMVVALFAAIKQIPIKYRISALLVMIYVLGMTELLHLGTPGSGAFFLLIFTLGSILAFSPQAGLTALFLSIASFTIAGFFLISSNPASPDINTNPSVNSDWVIYGFSVLLFGVIFFAGIQRLKLGSNDSMLETQLDMSTILEEKTALTARLQDQGMVFAKVHRIISEVILIQDPEYLLKQAVNLIQTEFDCYFTAIYLVDQSKKWANLAEATGEAGRLLKENKHRLDVDGLSAIGRAIRTQQHFLSHDAPTKPAWSTTPLLPYTRSQLALCMMTGSEVLGALDLQSTRAGAFSPHDISIFKALADQLSAAYSKAIEFSQARKSLDELKAAQNQYLRGVWASIAVDKNLEYELGEHPGDEGRELKVPLALRGQAIGDIYLENSGEWTTEQKSLVESILLQATLALENARLVEESQAVAVHEKLTNQLTAKIWASADLDAILQTTVRELGKSLEASEVTIELSMDDDNE